MKLKAPPQFTLSIDVQSVTLVKYCEQINVYFYSNAWGTTHTEVTFKLSRFLLVSVMNLNEPLWGSHSFLQEISDRHGFLLKWLDFACKISPNNSKLDLTFSGNYRQKLQKFLIQKSSKYEVSINAHLTTFIYRRLFFINQWACSVDNFVDYNGNIHLILLYCNLPFTSKQTKIKSVFTDMYC